MEANVWKLEEIRFTWAVRWPNVRFVREAMLSLAFGMDAGRYPLIWLFVCAGT